MLVNIALAAIITVAIYGIVFASTHEWGKSSKVEHPTYKYDGSNRT